MAHGTSVVTRREFSAFPDAAALSRAAAARLAELAVKAVEECGVFRLALSGGSTPLKLYNELAAAWKDRIPWQQTEIFWSDERAVSPDDARSNYGLAREHLLQHVPITPDRVFPMFERGNAAEAARAYEDLIRARMPEGLPGFDLIILGLGPDGHTASLFPGQDAVREEQRLVVAVPAPNRIEPRVPRITMTLPLINAADTILLLAIGTAKHEILEAVRSETGSENYDLPASMASARHQTLCFMAGD